MRKGLRAAVVTSLALWLPLVCPAQLSENVHTISVHVVFENDHPAGDRIRVRLVTGDGVTIGDTFTPSDSRVSFQVSNPGTYRAEVSGTPVEGTTTETFRVDNMDRQKVVFVRVKPAAGPASAATKSDVPPVTSAADLRVPAEAKKVFHKGMQAWEQNDYPKAAECFEKAVALFPEYDTAYNNLGVMYFRLNQPEKARAAFEKSVALNDHNADADRNLARILLHEGNYVRAEDLLKKSLGVEPLNPVTLTLLCVAQAQSGQPDAALATARKTHQLPHEGYSLVHFVAGQALEQKGQPQDAYAEYQTYLQESPSGAEAQQVRSAMARLTAANQPQPQ